MEGKLIGNRYEVIQKIGTGGMATVYKAKCILLKRFVAVKVLKPEFTNDEEFVKRFRVEAQAAASLSHPNIVSIYDVGKDDNVHYIVMEYIDGITLKEYIKTNGPLPWKEAVNIAAQICSAMDHAHRNHIIHRDIKPHNIILTKDGIAKVTDFGIARAVDSSTITMVGNTMGSVHYSSPEQARGGFIDEKSDIYSLGIALYEMTTGKVPFDGESPVAVALMQLQEEPKPPAVRNPDIPSGLNDIIMKAIRKDPSQRYQSAAHMLSDLNLVLRQPYADFAEPISYNDSPTIKIGSFSEKIASKSDKQNQNDYWKRENDMKKNSIVEEEENQNEKKKDKLTLWLAVITSIFLVGIFAFISYKLLMPSLFPDENFIVGNYVGKNIEDVRNELKDSGIVVKENRVFDDNYNKNIIIAQSIEPGQPIKRGSMTTLVLDVSDGPEMITIPDLRGADYRVAEGDLKKLGLVVKIQEEFSDKIGKDLVVRTEPEKDQKVRKGETVVIFRSLGPELRTVIVPKLIDLTRDEARRLILDNGLTVGSFFPKDVVSEVAKVVKQEPQAGETVPEGTKVDLYFEDAEANTPQPTVSQRNDFSYTLPLSDPDNYEDKIEVVVEIIPSDTRKPERILNRKINKDMFPVEVRVPVPVNGTTEIIVYYDNVKYLTDLISSP